jgi:hypothetical protein
MATKAIQAYTCVSSNLQCRSRCRRNLAATDKHENQRGMIQNQVPRIWQLCVSTRRTFHSCLSNEFKFTIAKSAERNSFLTTMLYRSRITMTRWPHANSDRVRQWTLKYSIAQNVAYKGPQATVSKSVVSFGFSFLARFWKKVYRGRTK